VSAVHTMQLVSAAVEAGAMHPSTMEVRRQNRGTRST
jgi:hypothetical protein